MRGSERGLIIARLVALLCLLLTLAGFRTRDTTGRAQPLNGKDEKSLLLEPAALKGNPPRAGVEEIRRNFQDPPAEFRTAPLWVWNDEMDPERIKEQLRQFKQQGMGEIGRAHV